MLCCLRLRPKPLQRIANRSYSYDVDENIERLWPKLLPQKVFTGTEAISKLKHASHRSKPLIITDKGLHSSGIAITMAKVHFATSKIEIHGESTPTPKSILPIIRSFQSSEHDSILGTFYSPLFCTPSLLQHPTQITLPTLLRPNWNRLHLTCLLSSFNDVPWASPQ